MSKNTLDDVFKKLGDSFDVEVPETAHETRFLNKLNNQNNKRNQVVKLRTNIWKPVIGIAASIILLVSISIGFSQKEAVIDLASVSPEMAKTETIFMAALSKELENINSEDMPEYQELIVDALFQIKVLEADYNQLIFGLKEQPDDELILSAMMLNFQSRINVLQDTKDKIKELNKSNKKITII